MSRSITIFWDEANWTKQLGTWMLEAVMDSVSDTCEALGYDMPDSGTVTTSKGTEPDVSESLPDYCYCTLDEVMDGHRHHCSAHKPCGDCMDDEDERDLTYE